MRFWRRDVPEVAFLTAGSLNATSIRNTKGLLYAIPLHCGKGVYRLVDNAPLGSFAKICIQRQS